MTNRKALTFALENCTLPADVAEKFEAMIAAIDKKNGAERKPTAKQTANADLRAQFVAYINDHFEGEGITCGAIAKEFELSPQKVSAILRQAVLAGEISKHSAKRVTYFTPFVEGEAEVEGE
jgi:predicted Rossmann fold nucleotide-binding protein DprA/Smf involved in DNA uptake